MIQNGEGLCILESKVGERKLRVGVRVCKELVSENYVNSVERRMRMMKGGWGCWRGWGCWWSRWWWWWWWWWWCWWWWWWRGEGEGGGGWRPPGSSVKSTQAVLDSFRDTSIYSFFLNYYLYCADISQHPFLRYYYDFSVCGRSLWYASVYQCESQL